MQLDVWMRLAGLDDSAVAEGAGVDRSTISRVRRGLQRPSWPLMDAIFRESRGAVRPDDFQFQPTLAPPQSRPETQP
jgi:transcriptional regulator with XRE-family HTH domain